MSDWQPIETAPKDGTEVLLWIPSYDPREGLPGFVDAAEWWAAPPEFACWVGVRSHSPYNTATHWMKLPEPPT